MDRRHAIRPFALPGQVAIMFALALSALLLVIGLGVDVGGALMVKSGQSGALEAAAQSCMTRANAVKYSAHTGQTARAHALEVLSASGYTGAAEVWYAEADAASTGPSDRHGATYLVLSQPHETSLLAIAGFDEIEVSTGLAWAYHPYSDGSVFRPADLSQGWERVEMVDGAVTSREAGACSLDTSPEPLRDAVEASMDL